MDLRGNGTGPIGAVKLSESMSLNTVLTCLAVDCSNVGRTGAVELARMIEANRTLCELHLRVNDLSPDGAVRYRERGKHTGKQRQTD